MAGLIGLTSSDLELQDALRVAKWEYEGEWIPHPVVRLSTTLPIAVERDGQRVAVRARWGFPVGGTRTVGNARDDRLTESRMWSSMLARTPCLVPATGVYEMVREPIKTSYWFRRVDGKPIVMPGLAGVRNLKGGKTLCAAIVTTEPNAFFKRFHNRQVCAVEGDQMDAWMSANTPEEALGVLSPPRPEDWEAVPVEDTIFRPGRVEMEHLVETGQPIRHEA